MSASSPSKAATKKRKKVEEEVKFDKKPSKRSKIIKKEKEEDDEEDDFIGSRVVDDDDDCEIVEEEEEEDFDIDKVIKDEKTNEEDIFSRFTDPTIKKKKTEIKEKKKKEKKSKNLNADKIFAKNVFNKPLNSSERQMVSRNLLPGFSFISKEDLKKRLESVSKSEIGYKIKTERGLNCVFGFINCASHCNQWLERELKKIGFVQNATGYDPICVSHSCVELLHSTVECLKMAIKQLMRFGEI
jgi:hypothetical protein